LQKFIIEDHQLRIRTMFRTFYSMAKAVLTEGKGGLGEDHYESDFGKVIWIQV
jgi:hypothetical protein